MSEKRNYGEELSKLAPGDVAGQMEIIQDFIRKVMTKGVDYGEIPGIPTPTLLKGGAEKIIALFNGVRSTQIVSREMDWDREFTLVKKAWGNAKPEEKLIKGFVSYEVKCEILDPAGNIIGSGLGAANSFEKKFAAQGGGFDTQNSLLKIAEKRAMVDAALTMSRSSGMFTQDIEDMDLDKETSSYSKPKTTNTYSVPKAATQPTPVSTVPKSDVNENDTDWITDFGTDNFKGKPISSLSENSIKYYYSAVKENIKKKQDVERNGKILKIIERVAKTKKIVL